MDLRLNLKDLSNPKDIAQLVSAISELADSLDVLYTDTSPDGNISARQGRIAQYDTGSAYETWQNVDGGTTWQRIDGISGLQNESWGDYFSSSTIVGWAAGKSGNIYYKKIGDIVFVSFNITGTSNSTDISFTMPYALSSLKIWTTFHGIDNTSTYAFGLLQFNSGSTALLQSSAAGGSWTASGTKTVIGQFFYKTI